VINNGVHICMEPIGPFTLKLEFSFMVDFDMMLIGLLYGLEGLQPRIRGRFGYVVQFKLFFYLCYMCVDNDGCK
jgi:hypothetical protein